MNVSRSSEGRRRTWPAFVGAFIWRSPGPAMQLADAWYATSDLNYIAVFSRSMIDGPSSGPSDPRRVFQQQVAHRLGAIARDRRPDSSVAHGPDVEHRLAAVALHLL